MAEKRQRVSITTNEITSPSSIRTSSRKNNQSSSSASTSSSSSNGIGRRLTRQSSSLLSSSSLSNHNNNNNNSHGHGHHGDDDDSDNEPRINLRRSSSSALSLPAVTSTSTATATGSTRGSRSQSSKNKSSNGHTKISTLSSPVGIIPLSSSDAYELTPLTLPPLSSASSASSSSSLSLSTNAAPVSTDIIIPLPSLGRSQSNTGFDQSPLPALLLGGRPLPYVVTFGILAWLPLIDSMSLMYTSRACRSILTTYVSRAHEICIHDHHRGTRSAEDLLPHIGCALQLVQRYTVTLHVLCVSFALNWNTNPVEDADECVRIQLMLQDIIRHHRAHFQRLTADWRFKSVALLSGLISCPCLRAFNPHAAWMPRATVDILLLRAIRSCPMIDTLSELHTKEPFPSSVLYESSVRAILSAEDKLPLKQLGVDWLGPDSMRLLYQQTTLTRLDFGLAVETPDQQLEACTILETTWPKLPVLQRLTLTVRDDDLPADHTIVWRLPHLTILTLRELDDDTDWPVLPPIIAPSLTTLTGPLSFLHLANILHHSPCLTSIDCDLHTRGNFAEAEAGERALAAVMADGAGARLENISQRGDQPLPLSFLKSITTNCKRLHSAIIEAPKHACTAEDVIRLFMKLPKLLTLGVYGPTIASGTTVLVDESFTNDDTATHMAITDAPLANDITTNGEDRSDTKRTTRRNDRGPTDTLDDATNTTINGHGTGSDGTMNGNSNGAASDREYKRSEHRSGILGMPVPPSTLPSSAMTAAMSIGPILSSPPQRTYMTTPASPDDEPLVLRGLEELWLDVCSDELLQRLRLPSLLRMRLKGDSIKIEDAARIFEHAPKLLDLSMKGAQIIGCSSPLRVPSPAISSSSASSSSSFEMPSPASVRHAAARDLVPGVIPSVAAQRSQRRHGLESLSLCHGRCHADTMFTMLTWCHLSLRSLSLCTDGLGIILVADIHSLGMPALETFEWRGQLLDHPSLGVVCRFARSLPNLKSLTVPGSLTEEARQWVKTQTKGGKTKGRPGLNIRFTTHEH